MWTNPGFSRCGKAAVGEIGKMLNFFFSPFIFLSLQVMFHFKGLY